jgi:hypothetical protein
MACVTANHKISQRTYSLQPAVVHIKYPGYEFEGSYGDSDSGSGGGYFSDDSDFSSDDDDDEEEEEEDSEEYSEEESSEDENESAGVSKWTTYSKLDHGYVVPPAVRGLEATTLESGMVNRR